ncbi:MAG: flotillin-like protein FloA [Planctomycetes bacterium]|nr:flotillin-like protein FloA [Planctomycetota bacterium]
MAFLASILAQSDTNILYWVLGAVLLVVLVLVILLLKFVNLWIQAQLSKAPVSIFQLIGMSLRKVNPTVIVRAMISSIQAGIPISVRELEAHYLAGGNVMRVVSALIAADRANLGLDFRRAAAIDLAGRDVLEAVQTSVNPRVIDCPVQGKIAAMAKDGIQVLARARVTVRANIERLVGGATEETIIARVGEGIVSSIGSSNTHKDVLENPDSISRTVLHKGLDAGTAFEILSIDIADVDIGENIGSRLQADQAEADKRVAQAKAEERRAMAVAQEQEQSAQVMANRALFVLAEADVPKAMADALRSGRLGVMDYMKIQNVGADTRMRSEIASAEEKQTGRPEIGGEPR